MYPLGCFLECYMHLFSMENSVEASWARNTLNWCAETSGKHLIMLYLWASVLLVYLQNLMYIKDVVLEGPLYASRYEILMVA